MSGQRRTVGDEQDTSSSDEEASTKSPFITLWNHAAEDESRGRAEAQKAKAPQMFRPPPARRARSALVETRKTLTRVFSFERRLKKNADTQQGAWRVDSLKAGTAPMEHVSRSSRVAISKRLGEEAVRAIDGSLSCSPPSREGALETLRNAVEAIRLDTDAVRIVHVALERAECASASTSTLTTAEGGRRPLPQRQSPEY